MGNHVAIIGGGFSGALLAINLLRHGGPRATLIERRRLAGEGIAYGDADPSHLLNVRAANMSAFPDEPDHFVRWLEDRGQPGASGTFVARKLYGSYLRELLDSARIANPGRLTIIQGSAHDINCNGDTVVVLLDNGDLVGADHAVLAIGNLPPHAPPGLDQAAIASGCYYGDPWGQNPAKGLRAGDEVLILGTGLTMVDMVQKLQSSGFTGRITALSRRGLLPRAHGGQKAFRRIQDRPGTKVSSLVAAVRTRAGQVGWRNAVDELRPFTQSLWRAANADQRGRFLRHLRPWWDVHRHRIAPAVADSLDRLIAQGQLRVIAAKAVQFAPAKGGLEVTYRLRGQGAEQAATFARVINCLGPQGDLNRSSDPLLRRLLARDLLRPDPAQLGIDVDAQHRVVGASGSVSDRLLAVGPMTRGAFWEIVAVPDIRVQTWSLARRLSNAHWVGGEGL